MLYFKGTTNSGTRLTYFKYTDFGTTYHRSAQLPRKTYQFKGISFQRQNTKVHRDTENTLHRRKLEMVYARLGVQQFTHPVHPNSSFRLSYLLRQLFVDKTGKIRQTAQTKYNERKNKQTRHRKNMSLFRKVIASQRPAPIKLLVLLGSPSCRPLPLLRRTHEVLANGSLLCSGVVVVVHSDFWLNSVVVYPDVWL